MLPSVPCGVGDLEITHEIYYSHSILLHRWPHDFLILTRYIDTSRCTSVEDFNLRTEFRWRLCSQFLLEVSFRRFPEFAGGCEEFTSAPRPCSSWSRSDAHLPLVRRNDDRNGLAGGADGRLCLSDCFDSAAAAHNLTISITVASARDTLLGVVISCASSPLIPSCLWRFRSLSGFFHTSGKWKLFISSFFLRLLVVEQSGWVETVEDLWNIVVMHSQCFRTFSQSETLR